VTAFEPKIVVFCCYYCGYSAADLAGSLRLQYPANVRLVELPCSGKVEQNLLLAAFEEGADGVYVVGCMEGDCHYLRGNLRARKRVEHVRKILDELGVGGERLAMFNLSSSMGPRFAAIAAEMTERIRKLGPNPCRPAGRRAAGTAADAEKGGGGR